MTQKFTGVIQTHMPVLKTTSHEDQITQVVTETAKQTFQRLKTALI